MFEIDDDRYMDITKLPYRIYNISDTIDNNIDDMGIAASSNEISE